MTDLTTDLDLNEIQREVRDRYREAALAASSSLTQAEAARKSEEAISGCCGPVAQQSGIALDGSKLDAAHADGCCTSGCCSDVSGTYGLELYDAAAREGIPDAALLASLGCGNPVAVAELRAGETVLDLGSGGGIDVLLSARRVGPTGRAIGVDMTDEMLDLARANAAQAGVENVEFLKGYIEDIPLPDDTVDVVISNCVINLSVDKRAVLREAARVLRPGGRFAVSDVIADDDMDEATRADMARWTGCIAGALTRGEFRQALTDAGLEGVEITETHRVHAHAASVIIRAHKP
jgi:arsenite methyltransferase